LTSDLRTRTAERDRHVFPPKSLVQWNPPESMWRAPDVTPATRPERRARAHNRAHLPQRGSAVLRWAVSSAGAGDMCGGLVDQVATLAIWM
jgi:hypothetical protein